MKPFKFMFDFEHVLTPIAVEHLIVQRYGKTLRRFKILYIFGIRVFYWNTGDV